MFTVGFCFVGVIHTLHLENVKCEEPNQSQNEGGIVLWPQNPSEITIIQKSQCYG